MSIMSLRLSSHSGNEEVVEDFQCLGIKCLNAKKKKWRRGFFARESDWGKRVSSGVLIENDSWVKSLQRQTAKSQSLWTGGTAQPDMKKSAQGSLAVPTLKFIPRKQKEHIVGTFKWECWLKFFWGVHTRFCVYHGSQLLWTVRKIIYSMWVNLAIFQTHYHWHFIKLS